MMKSYPALSSWVFRGFDKRGEIVLHGLQGPNAVSAGIARAAAAVGENCIPDQGVSKEHAPVVRARAAALRLISRSGTDVTHPRLTSVHGEVRGRVDQKQVLGERERLARPLSEGTNRCFDAESVVLEQPGELLPDLRIGQRLWPDVARNRRRRAAVNE